MLKAAVLAVALLTGAVRDVHGIPIGGATITGLDAAGTPLSHSTTDSEGTFALQTAATPASVRVECPYCRTLVLRVTAGEPVVAVVQRYDALLNRGPSEWDLDALPYSRLENSLALRPYEVLRIPSTTQPFFGPSLSDRGLGFNALVLDGEAPTYAVGFGELTALSTTPAHAGTLVNVRDSANAFAYGPYATGGIIQLSRNPALVEQTGIGDVDLLRFSAGGTSVGATAASESESGLVQRERVVAGAQASVLGGSLSGQFSASRAESGALGNPRVSLDTASLGFARAFGRYQLQVSAADGFGTVAAGAVAAVWNDAALRAAVATRAGAVTLEAGTTYLNDSYTIASALSYSSDTTYLQATLSGPASVQAGIAQTMLFGEGRTRNATLPSLLVTQSLGRFAVTGGVSQSLPIADLYANPIAASLMEAHLEYGDGNRLRADAQTYRQVFGAAQLAGSGASVTYQITPEISVRAWSLRLFGDQSSYNAQAYISGDSLWTTYANGGFRLDAIYRRTAAVSGNMRAVDGDIYFPISRSASIGLRSELQPQGRRSALVLTVSP